MRVKGSILTPLWYAHWHTTSLDEGEGETRRHSFYLELRFYDLALISLLILFEFLWLAERVILMDLLFWLDSNHNLLHFFQILPRLTVCCKLTCSSINKILLRNGNVFKDLSYESWKKSNKRLDRWLSLILLLLFLCWLCIALLISLNYPCTYSSRCLWFPQVCMCKC